MVYFYKIEDGFTMYGKPREGTKMLGTQVTDDVAARISNYARETGQPVSRVIETAVVAFIGGDERPVETPSKLRRGKSAIK